MKVRAPNIHPFAANGHFSLYYRPFFSLSSYLFDLETRHKQGNVFVSTTTTVPKSDEWLVAQSI